jgi:ell wall binding domain 2 (CWB2)
VLSPPPRRWPRLLLAGVGILALIGGAYVGYRALEDDESGDAPAPQVVSSGEEQRAVAAEQLGFPGFATKNTTRIGGADSAAVAAGAALATFPSQGGLDGPAAVSMVAADDWASAVAASSLVAAPIGAPVLVSAADEVPELTSTAVVALGPRGSPETDDAQVFTLGDVATPDGLRETAIEGANPAERAAAIADLRTELTEAKPRNILLASSDDAAFAMPAAAWAARSGDPVLFVQRNTVPSATLELLEKHEDVPVYLLGPESVVSEQALDEIKKVAPQVVRIAAEDPVSNAIEFARFSDGEFGWNINDPGHGMVIANVGRPMDAGAASPLSGSGTWGPLLLTDASDVVPGPLRGYLLDIKPGYVSDPTRAFYNHAWLVGDDKAMSVGFQAQVDELLEIAPIQEGVGDVGFDTGNPEREPKTQP